MPMSPEVRRRVPILLIFASVALAPMVGFLGRQPEGSVARSLAAPLAVVAIGIALVGGVIAVVELRRRRRARSS